MVEPNYCFSARRTCHHDEYCAVINKVTHVRNLKRFGEKLKALFSGKTIVFLDIDRTDLLFLPLIIIRSLWGAKGIGVSVRTEYVLGETSLIDFLQSPWTNKYFRILIKRALFLSLKHFSSTIIISIHKNHPKQKQLEQYVNYFIYDPQLWDLTLLNPSVKQPVELLETSSDKFKTRIVILGRLNEQRSRVELMKFLKKKETRLKEPFLYIFAGEMSMEDQHYLEQLPYCKVINRRTTDEELFFLLNDADAVYCYYTNDRPSGFFGRALQMKKHILVRQNGYLHRQYGDYGGLIPLSNLDAIIDTSVADGTVSGKGSYLNPYDDSDLFKELAKDCFKSLLSTDKN